MADNTTEIVGIKSGVLEKALKKDGIPAWATEKTLYKISKTLDQLVAGNASLAKEINNSALDEDQLAKILAKLGKEKEREQPKELTDSETRAQKIMETWGSKNLLILNGTAKAFGIMRETVTTSVNAFTELYQSGISLGSAYSSAADSFDIMRQMVMDTGMKLSDFASVIKNYSTSVNAISASRLAKAMPVVSSNLTKFGYDLAGAADVIGAYTDIQLALGNVQNKSNREIEEESAQLGKSMSMLATITGQARNKLIEQTRAMASSVEANLIAIRSGETAARSASAFAASFKDAEVGKKFIEMMASGVPVLNSTFQSLVKVGSGPFAERLVSFSKSIKDLKPEEQAIALKDFLGKNEQYITQEMQRLQPLAEAGVEGARESLELMTKLRSQREALANKTDDEIRQEQAANQAINDLKVQWSKLMSTFAKVFQPSIPLMSAITTSLSWLNSAIDTTVSSLNKAFSAVIDYVVNPVMKLAGFEQIEASFGGLITGIVAVTAAVLGLRKAISIAVALARVASGSALGNAVSTGATVAGSVGTAAGSAAGSVGKGLGSLAKGVGSGFSSIMEGLAKGLAAFGGGLGVKAVIGAGLLGTAIAALSVTLSAGAAVSMAILSKTLPDFTKTLGELNGINAENLKNVGSALVSLSAGLAAFSVASISNSASGLVSGILSSISNLFGGSTIDRIKEFSSIGAGLSAAGSGLSVFNTELDRIMNTDLSKLDKVAKGLGKLSVPIGKITANSPNGNKEKTSPIAEVNNRIEKTSRSVPQSLIDYPDHVALPESSKGPSMAPVVQKLDELVVQLKSNTSIMREILKYTRVQA